MNKRYQVFLSSTYEDLREERSAAILALLKLDCFPAGMELFPSSDDSVWQVIKKTIDESDYYVLIIAGRYGSISNDGEKSWTEREYDYAQERGKPTFVFLYKDLTNISRGKIDDEEKVKLFREKVGKRIHVTCDNIDVLRAEITLALAKAIREKPAIGWIRADRFTALSDGFTYHNDAEELQKIIDAPQTFHVDVYEYNYIQTYDIMTGTTKTKIRQKYASEDKSLIDIFPFIAKDANAIKTRDLLSFNNSIIRSVIGKHKTSTNGLFIDNDIARDVVGEMMMQGLLKRDEQNMFVVTDLGYRLYKKITESGNS